MCKEQSWAVNISLIQVRLLAYDTLLTLPFEITYIWPRRVILGTVLYLLARYPALLDFIFNVMGDTANIPLEFVGVKNGGNITALDLGALTLDETFYGVPNAPG
ncbi:hypothetical protein JB92DRAFT_2824648 [Gautieria morchelliformis]|nr:hypothetical protein JB92DRAFT_2824648 [Gautieria morchelliformis]